MTYIGIDVSKNDFVVAYSPDKSCRTRTFKNTTKGIHEFIRTICKDEHHCVMEATGNYSALLVYLLSEAGITTSLEKADRFAYLRERHRYNTCCCTHHGHWRLHLL